MATFYATYGRPYSHSKRWRMKFNRGRYASGQPYRAQEADTPLPKARMYFTQQQANFLYDEYDAPWFSTTRTGSVIPLKEIPALLVTHEIGDGENDYKIDKVHADINYDTVRYGAYTYNAVANADPSFIVDLRSQNYAGQTPQKRLDLIALNMAVKPGINPFISVRMTPGDIDIPPNEEAIYREALALRAPLTARFRRCRVEVGTLQKATSVRNIMIQVTEYPRRTWG